MQYLKMLYVIKIDDKFVYNKNYTVREYALAREFSSRNAAHNYARRNFKNVNYKIYSREELCNSSDPNNSWSERMDDGATIITDKNCPVSDKYVNKTGKTVIYARVSDCGKKADLIAQTELLRNFAQAKELVVDKIFQEIGSGLDYNRKKWNRLIDDCTLGSIKAIIISSRDRFVQCGFEWFERFLNSNGVEIIIADNSSSVSQQDFFDDLTSVFTVLNKKKKSKKSDELNQESLEALHA